MRRLVPTDSYMRVGIGVGSIACLLVIVLQTQVAAAVALVVVATGVAAGLATAKWLDRSYFGRQLEAGLRAGGIAAGAAGLAALLALLIAGPHESAVLAARSHIFTLNLSGLIHGLAPVGWIGADVLMVLAAEVAGTALAGLTTLVLAWSKSRRALLVVAQAREAADALRQSEAWAPAAITNSLAYSPSGLRTGAPVPVGVVAAVPQQAAQSPSAASLKPATQAKPLAPVSRAEYDAETSATAAAPPKVPTRVPSKARPAEKQLTDAMRDALASWANDNPDTVDEAPTPAQRKPQHSAYLNSDTPAPAPKRARKKPSTRDWLC